MAGWVGLVGWLISERFTYKVVKQSSISLAQDMESSPARTDVLTTMLRHQPVYHVSMYVSMYESYRLPFYLFHTVPNSVY